MLRTDLKQIKMTNLSLKANLGINNGKVYVGLSLVEFIEDDVVIIYSPALDLSGYGHSQEEAKTSFSEATAEFFRYTSNKKTLNSVLKALGWSVKGSKMKRTFIPPKDSDLVSTNSLYNDIVNNKSYKVSRENVEFSLQ
jgi:hypothetical protein